MRFKWLIQTIGESEWFSNIITSRKSKKKSPVRDYILHIAGWLHNIDKENKSYVWEVS